MTDRNQLAANTMRPLFALCFVMSISSGTTIKAQEVNPRVDSVDASVHARVDEERGNAEGSPRVAAKQAPAATWSVRSSSGAPFSRGKAQATFNITPIKSGSSVDAAMPGVGGSTKIKEQKNSLGSVGIAPQGSSAETFVTPPATNVLGTSGSPFKIEHGASPFGSKQWGLTHSNSPFATSNHVGALVSQPHGKGAAKKTPTTVTGKTATNSTTKKK
jgi:hypothetical protein